MANSSIPLSDKRLVTRRLAEGMSTRAAIAGTSVRSNQTAARWARSLSHEIAQRREAYVAIIEDTMLGSTEARARVLGDMVHATKTLRVTLPENPDALFPVKRRDYFVEVEDWDSRLKAIKYIDQLAGLNVEPAKSITVIQQTNKTITD